MKQAVQIYAVCFGGVIAMALAMGGCDLAKVVDPDKATRWAVDKAARLVECEILAATTQKERRECMGEFVSDLGSDACGATEKWLDSGVAR